MSHHSRRIYLLGCDVACLMHEQPTDRLINRMKSKTSSPTSGTTFLLVISSQRSHHPPASAAFGDRPVRSGAAFQPKFCVKRMESRKDRKNLAASMIPPIPQRGTSPADRDRQFVTSPSPRDSSKSLSFHGVRWSGSS